MSNRDQKSCRVATIRAKRGSESGFILTLELILLLSILGVCVYFGIEVYQQWYFNQIDPIGGPNARIYDSTTPDAKLIAVAEAYSRQEAPIALYRPYVGTANVLGGSAALLGFRRNSFSTRTRVYYTANGCAGTPYLIDHTSKTKLKAANDLGEPISDFYGLQGVEWGVGKIGVNYILYPTQLAPPPAFVTLGPLVCPSAAPFANSVNSYFDSEAGNDGECIDFVAADCARVAVLDASVRNASVADAINLSTTFLPNVAVNDTTPDYWVPTTINPAAPPVTVQTGSLDTIAPGNESKVHPPLGGVTMTGGEGQKHY